MSPVNRVRDCHLPNILYRARETIAVSENQGTETTTAVETGESDGALGRLDTEALDPLVAK